MGAANRWPDYVVDAWNILFWDLNEPLPQMADKTMEEIEGALKSQKAA